MLQCSQLAHTCSLDDLITLNDVEKQCVELWKKIDTMMIIHRAYTCDVLVISGCMVSVRRCSLTVSTIHNLGTLFSVSHLLGISSSHLCEAGPRLFSCFTSASYIPAAFPFLSAAIPFLYYSEKGYTSVTVYSTWLEVLSGGIASLERLLGFPLLATVMCQISRSYDFFPSLPFHLSVSQPSSSNYGCVSKWID